jgi:hypothetical protein
VAINSEVQQFVDLIRPWFIAYRQVSTSWLAIRRSNTEPWCLTYANIDLHVRTTDWPCKPFSIATPNLCAGSQIRSLDGQDFDKWTDKLSIDPFVLEVDGYVFELRPTEQNNFTLRTAQGAALPLYRHDYHFHSRGLWPPTTDQRRAALQISASHTTTYLPAEDFELQLFNASSPVNGISDLLARIDAPDWVTHGNQAPRVNIRARAPANFDKESFFRDHAAEISVAIPPGLERSLFSLGLVQIEESGTAHSSAIPNDQVKWRDRSATNDINLKAIFTGLTASSVIFFLRYQNEYLDRLALWDETRSPNELAELHRLIDRTHHLGKLLKSADADGFEKGLALLLGNLGLAVLDYGQIAQFSDGPDMYAISRDRDLYVIETTIGHPDHKGKLLKLHKRAQEVSSVCQRRGLTFKTIQAILATTLPRDNTLEVAAEAADLGIALICQEELVTWYGSLSNSRVPTPEEFNRDIRRANPGRDEINETPNAKFY